MSSYLRRAGHLALIAVVSAGLLGGCIIKDDDNDHDRGRNYSKRERAWSNGYQRGVEDSRSRRRGWW